MFWYFLVALVLTGLALAESGERKDYQLFGMAAAAILIIFGGLRHETGYDWMEYERYFDYINSFGLNEPRYSDPDLLVEIGFAFFVKLIKTTGIGFQGLLFVISAINMITIYKFSSRYSGRVALVMAWYFGLLFLPAQMAAIRQSLSFSFILLAFMAIDDKRTIRSAIFCLMAVSTHIFSIVFIPLLYLKIKPPKVSLVAVFSAAGLIMAFLGVHLIAIVADFIVPRFSGFASTKIGMYGELGAFELSYFSIALVGWHIGFLYFVTRGMDNKEYDNLTLFAIRCTLLSIFAHSYLATFPAVWNRAALITMLLQMIVLTVKYQRQLNDVTFKFGFVGGAASAAALALAYTLTNPASLPFIPYQSAIYVWATGDSGDGRIRYAYQMQEAERQFREQRR